MIERIERLRERLRELGEAAALVRSPLNVGYLSGFTGSTAALLVTGSEARFITDSRYATQAQRECPGLPVVLTETGGTYEERIAAEVKALGLTRVAVEADHTTLRQARDLEEALAGAAALAPVKELLTSLRRVKDADELARTRRACAIADAGFAHVLTLIRPGITERDLAVELEYFMKKQGSEKEAFDTIVASGHRSALPHGRASEKTVEVGDFITFDFGARWEGYHSDLTRTVVVGQASEEQRRVYETVLDAQLAALASIRAGVEAKSVDAVARERIAAAGYGEKFGHSLGHALGLDVHDGPGFGPRSDFTLAPGMLLTVEPGVYLEGWGGVRIEDDVVVTEDGCEVLTHSPKQLLEVGA